MSSLPPPSFIVRDPAQVVADMTAQFEADAGKTLYPAQVETLYINQVAYRESLLREAIQAAGLQNLIDFATYPRLEYLGVFYGVRGQRLPAQAAVVTLQFTFPAAFDYPVYVPVGIRVASSNGLIIFTTQSAALLSVGSTIATVTAICSMTGIVGNGFVSGQISNLLDDVGVAGVTATNTTSSSGGADQESDDRYRQRLKLVPESFTTAGSVGAYEFWALSAHSAITDVSVTSPTPGSVAICVMTGLSTPSDALLTDVLAACSSATRRPLCDTVNAFGCTIQTYTIVAALTLYAGTDPTAAVANVETELNSYATGKSSTLGLDIVIDQIIAAIMSVNGIYSVAISSPSASIIIPPTQTSQCTMITVTVAGYADE